MAHVQHARARWQIVLRVQQMEVSVPNVMQIISWQQKRHALTVHQKQIVSRAHKQQMLVQNVTVDITQVDLSVMHVVP